MLLKSKAKIFWFLTGTILVFIHFIFLLQFLPNDHGLLGHDYAIGLTQLVDGYLWFKNNGPWSLPWFTPSFCGGIVKLAGPQNNYLWPMQFFTLFINPIQALQLTYLLMSSLGFIGFYLLAKNIFKLTTMVSFVGASFFLFNDFYFYRMAIGHFAFHLFPLVPLICYLLLTRPNEKSLFFLLRQSVLCSLIFALMVLSMVLIFVPVQLTIVGIIAIYFIVVGNRKDFLVIFGRYFISVVFTIILVLPWYLSSSSLLANFPRSYYPLSGMTFFNTLTTLFLSLFFYPAHQFAAENMLNTPFFTLGRHEFEYGITWIPLLLILVGTFLSKRKIFNKIKKSWIEVAIIFFILLLPILLNTYTPWWNKILKSFFLFKSTSTLTRWFVIYIPIVILLATLALAQLKQMPKTTIFICLFSVIYLIFNLRFTDNKYYQDQNYDPSLVIKHYNEVKSGNIIPQIETIGVYAVDKNFKQNYVGNNLFALGASQMRCYEPIFGYRFEGFIFKTLHIGSIWDVQDEHFNMKNPSCYLFPKENSCQPGDHFSIDQRESLQQFSSYRPFDFKIPVGVKISLYLTGTLLALQVLMLLAIFVQYLKKLS